MFCLVGSTYLTHFVQSVSYSYRLVYISIFREWPVESIHNWIGTMTLRMKAIILCRKLSGFHILKSIWGTWDSVYSHFLPVHPCFPSQEKNHFLQFQSALPWRLPHSWRWKHQIWWRWSHQYQWQWWWPRSSLHTLSCGLGLWWAQSQTSTQSAYTFISVVSFVHNITGESVAYVARRRPGYVSGGITSRGWARRLLERWGWSCWVSQLWWWRGVIQMHALLRRPSFMHALYRWIACSQPFALYRGMWNHTNLQI